ncbi:EboA domain-containing protein [Chitinophaga sp. Hz27]|uniref:EboA domain-containing protein n=1 Tax=Chitinophaga sp. Hz27 TaxID=3347169 RepID=UPI0035D79015
MTAYVYDLGKVSLLLFQLLQEQGNENARLWLEKRRQIQESDNSMQQYLLTFTAIPRFIGKQPVSVSEETANALQKEIPELFVYDWTLDRLARAWWLLLLPADDKSFYLQQVENLFNGAEMNELATLYSALPLLAYPEEWVARTAEGIRSNIGPVQEAIMVRNPYPAQYLPEAAWNQLVMKAIFTDKPLQYIYGLSNRANATLAAIIVDFAHERQAAGRSVNPLQWQLLSQFLNEGNFSDISRLWNSALNVEKEAAALVCSQSNYMPAKELLAQAPEINQEISQGTISWNTIAQKISLQ